MTKFVTLLGRKPVPTNGKPAFASEPAQTPFVGTPSIPPLPPLTSVQSVPTTPVSIAPAPTQGLAAAASKPGEIDLDDELFFPAAAQLGQENEAIRNLLMDAEHKIGELETIKQSIAKLVDPVCNTLRGYEETKSDKLILQRALNTSREAGNKLRDDLAAAEKKAAAFKIECTRLQEIVSTTKQNLVDLERLKAKHLAELSANRVQLADLNRIAQQQAGDLQLSRGENRRLAERVAAADQRTVQLEGETQAAQQEARQANQERVAIQASLDKTLSDLAQTARKLSDAEKALASAQMRVSTLEVDLADAQAETAQLSAALDEAGHQTRDEVNVLNARVEAMQARSNLTDNLLDEARRALMARADEIRTFERRLIEAASAHEATTERLSTVEAALTNRELQIRDLENARMVLTEEAHKLVQAATAREAVYGATQRQFREQGALVEVLQEELNAARGASEIQIENLNAKLQREQLDRSMAEGALEAARKDIARLIQEIGVLRGGPAAETSADAPSLHELLKQAA